MRDEISFVRRGKRIREKIFSPTETLLDYLRLREHNKSVKEGCCEGDCGACTVALGKYQNGRVTYSPVNACIYPLGMVDGTEIVTAGDLADATGALHPVQAAMVNAHGSQCGFCTPGFVMSLFVLWSSNDQIERADINDCLSGNLCRCTGYRPIVEAAFDAINKEHETAAKTLWPNTQEELSKFTADQASDDFFIGDDQQFFAAPASLKSALDLYARHQDCVLVAGATDVGLWITKKLSDIKKIIWLGRVEELLKIDETDQCLTLGGAVTYEAAEEKLGAIHPDIAHLLRRLGSRQVRASGTIGGNIANGSPIGDMPPILIALDATITLRSANGQRQMPIGDFFIRYGQQDIKPGEILTAIDIPPLRNTDVFTCGKISKRFDQDISSVMGVVRLTMNGAEIVDARIAFGGMAETPRRATHTEQALIGISIDDTSTIDQSLAMLKKDFDPLSDMRASADYRLQSATGFLKRSMQEFAGTPKTQTRIHAFEV